MEPLHQGANSQVFDAINVCWPDAVFKKGYKLHIEEEAHMLQLARHPNIVRVEGLLETTQTIRDDEGTEHAAAYMALQRLGPSLETVKGYAPPRSMLTSHVMLPCCAVGTFNTRS